ncbi:hypothetical protein G7Z17_g284 [Cylindrodendrum hubeiense]|uniref:Peptidase S8/S53 domain-containing protein n=1 Tax=Cylindrodendrum hubeiense TaxID=595255 RepID=A0A9P5HLH9_9HYPO|nr:hypothetical protein G7Z17_g284 [Cylindrodendrum hubeiense]
MPSAVEPSSKTPAAPSKGDDGQPKACNQLTASLHEVTKNWVHQIKQSDSKDLSTEGANLVNNLQLVILAQMQQNATAEDTGDDQFKTGLLEGQQHRFVWDDAVATEFRDFINNPPSGIDGCVLWCMMSEAVRLLLDALRPDDGSYDESDFETDEDTDEDSDAESIQMPRSPSPSPHKDKRRLEVLQILLKLDEDEKCNVRLADKTILFKAVQSTFTNINGNDGNVAALPTNTVPPYYWQESQDSDAHHNPMLATVEMILQYRGDLKTKEAVLNVLNRGPSSGQQRGKREMERIQAQLIDLVANNAEKIVDEDVLQIIMENELVDVWSRTPIKHAVSRLVEDGETAKRLFCTSLKLEKNLCFSESIVNASRFELDFDLMSEIVRCGRLDVLKLEGVQNRWKKIHDNEPTRCMLHIAVQHRQVGFVKHFLKEEPHSVTRAVPFEGNANEDTYPLWHLNFDEDGKPRCRPLLVPETQAPIPNIHVDDTASMDSAVDMRSRILTTPSKTSSLVLPKTPNITNDQRSSAKQEEQEIRKLLVHATIEHADGMKTIAKIFRDSKEAAVGQICFDLSRFAASLYSVKEFLQSLKALEDEHSKRHLKFEEVLRYFEFPALDLDGWNKGPERYHHVHREVFDTLDWLTDRHVTRIMKLTVLDRMYDPHDEEKIALMVEKFKVSTLDWRHLDMAISCFTTDTKKRLTELHLYSSGKTAVVDHWLSADGIESLENVVTVKIHFIQDLMTPDCFTRLKRKITQKEFKGRKAGFKCTPVRQTWDSLPPNNAKDLSEIAERAVPDLSPYITKYDDQFSDAAKNHKGLWPRIKEGHSFVDNASRLPSWLFASDPHGTQMANLICAIDPHCELYVAKIVEGRQGITPDNVAEAIHWAISKKVDIISMSFSIPDFTNSGEYSIELKKAVEEANSKDIIQFCSHHDEGWNVKHSWPASCDTTKVIVACNEFGNFPDRDVGNYDYKIHGMDISAGTVPYLESDDSVSGSSVATAMVAGVASLMLSCRRMEFPDKRFGATGVEHYSRKNFVESMLNKISDEGNKSESNSKRYMRLGNFSNFLEDKDGEEIYSWLK